jgi:3-oxoacyl-(acyl-carrier-protein) synthase
VSRYFSKENTYINVHDNGAQIIKKIETKATIKQYFTLTRMATIKQSSKSRAGHGAHVVKHSTRR